MDTHSPYVPESKYDKWGTKEERNIQTDHISRDDFISGKGYQRQSMLENLYDGAILQADSIIEKLVTELKQREIFDDTLLIITSDHGEAFGETSLVDPDVRLAGHKWGIHEVLTHVPLIVKYPNQNSGGNVSDVVSLTEIPCVIKSVVEDGWKQQNLFVKNQPVMSSNRKMKESKITNLEPQNRNKAQKYIGPWRAVYDNRDGKVIKHAMKRDKYATIEITSAQNKNIVTREKSQRVFEEFNQLSDSNVVDIQQKDINDELENHLRDLGYMT